MNLLKLKYSAVSTMLCNISKGKFVLGHLMGFWNLQIFIGQYNSENL